MVPEVFVVVRGLVNSFLKFINAASQKIVPNDIILIFIILSRPFGENVMRR